MRRRNRKNISARNVIAALKSTIPQNTPKAIVHIVAGAVTVDLGAAGIKESSWQKSCRFRPTPAHFPQISHLAMLLVPPSHLPFTRV
ncbi:hypothetical protein ACP_0391 [Acidobacterium capsulatum ATCC 51196]|uniref:Uncharacterized protein n=1 Tax=Acidobacterium capsulatum (strain ATCC 51196 / DSM 11244 / BCRC 80197 / JCM 7670 / NBRC 15755 / NCIMB 13165 / 161) TaxID=240015 RepID=C1FA12_ACIC5|nr:hypothetical protein ACP_0391 [Acidobacterium capsulatum ATCC 51196]